LQKTQCIIKRTEETEPEETLAQYLDAEEHNANSITQNTLAPEAKKEDENIEEKEGENKRKKTKKRTRLGRLYVSDDFAARRVHVLRRCVNVCEMYCCAHALSVQQGCFACANNVKPLLGAGINYLIYYSDIQCTSAQLVSELGVVDDDLTDSNTAETTIHDRGLDFDVGSAHRRLGALAGEWRRDHATLWHQRCDVEHAEICHRSDGDEDDQDCPAVRHQEFHCRLA
jgi:hypothetical protein